MSLYRVQEFLFFLSTSTTEDKILTYYVLVDLRHKAPELQTQTSSVKRPELLVSRFFLEFQKSREIWKFKTFQLSKEE